MQSLVPAESRISAVVEQGESGANLVVPSESGTDRADHMSRSSLPTEIQTVMDGDQQNASEYGEPRAEEEEDMRDRVVAARHGNGKERREDVEEETTTLHSQVQNGGFLQPERKEEGDDITGMSSSSGQCVTVEKTSSQVMEEISSIQTISGSHNHHHHHVTPTTEEEERGRSEPKSSLLEEEEEEEERQPRTNQVKESGGSSAKTLKASPDLKEEQIITISASITQTKPRRKGPARQLQPPPPPKATKGITSSEREPSPTSAKQQPTRKEGNNTKDFPRLTKSSASSPKTDVDNTKLSAVSRVKSKDLKQPTKEPDKSEMPSPLAHQSSGGALPNGGSKDKMQQRSASPSAALSATLPSISGTGNSNSPSAKDRLIPTKASTIRPVAASLSLSSSSEKIITNPGVRTSPHKPTSRFVELRKHVPSSPGSVRTIQENGTSPERNGVVHQRRASLEGDRLLPAKVKELFPRRNSIIGMGGRKFRDSESVVSSEHTAASVLVRENADLGPFLLKLAKQAVTSGENLYKALDYASRAAKSFENAADGRPSLDLVMSLHILAAIHCTLGQFEEAISVLKHSIVVPDSQGGGQDHALATFAGNMQLGDTYALLGRGDDALAAYHAGLEVQKRALGDKDPRVGETCRYIAEAHTQAMQFDKAEELCQHALDIHKEHSAPASMEEATDRRLMGLICNAKGQYEAALEHLVLASMALIANGKDVDVAAVDVSIGDAYVCLGRYDEAVFAYQKALTVFKSSEGENHVSVASVYVSLAEAYLKIGKIRESKTYCDSALRIYTIKQQGVGNQLNEVASGLTDLAVVYEALSEQEQALSLLRKALAILETVPGQQSTIAGVEAQIGVLSYMRGSYADARTSFSKATVMLRASAEKNTALFGIVLNQMGLCCLHLSDIGMAVKLFEESREVLETVSGPHHPDTLSVYSNLAAAYDASGRLDDAINALQYVVEVREEELGTAEPEVEDERNRLAELLKEAGRLRARRLNNTLGLLMQPKTNSPMNHGIRHNNASLSVSVNV